MISLWESDISDTSLIPRLNCPMETTLFKSWGKLFHKKALFDLQFQQIIHTVSFRCLTFISPDLKRFQHETSTTLTATTNSSSHENTLVQRAHARFPLARGGYNNSRQCQSHFRSPTETPVSGLLLETNNKTIKLKCSAFDILHLATCGSKLRLSL